MSTFISTPITLALSGIQKGYIDSQPFYTGNYWSDHANSFSNRIFPAILLISLHHVTQIHIESLAYIPLPAVLIPVLGLVIARRYLDKMTLYLPYYISLVFSPLILLTQLGGYQSLGYIYHFLIIYFVIILMKYKQMIKNVLPIIVILLIASYQSYYTVEFSNLMLFISMFFLSIIVNNKRLQYIHILFTLSLIALLIFLAFDDILYRISESSPLEKRIQMLINGINTLLHRLYEAQSKYSPTASSNILYDISRRLMIISIVIYYLINALHKYRIDDHKLFILSISLLIYSIVEIIIYQAVTNDYLVSRNMILTLPLVVFIILVKSSLPISTYPINSIIISIILLLSVINYFVAINNHYQDLVSENLRDISTETTRYLITRLHEGTHVLGSMELSSMLFVRSIEYSVIINSMPFDKTMPVIRDSLINNDYRIICSKFITDNIILPNLPDRFLRGELWGGEKTISAPLGTSLYNINNFRCYNKVYDNSYIFYYNRFALVL